MCVGVKTVNINKYAMMFVIDDDDDDQKLLLKPQIISVDLVKNFFVFVYSNTNKQKICWKKIKIKFYYFSFWINWYLPLIEFSKFFWIQKQRRAQEVSWTFESWWRYWEQRNIDERFAIQWLIFEFFFVEIIVVVLLNVKII